MKRFTSIFAVIVLSVLIGAGAVVGIDAARDGGSKSTVTTTSAQSATNGTQPVSSSSSSSAAPANGDFSALYDSVRPSVVEITIGTQGSNAFNQRAEGLGSGIVLDTDGHILTNYHVVTGSKTVTITFADGATAQADVVGNDPGNDVAVVKANVDASELHPPTLGDSSTDARSVTSSPRSATRSGSTARSRPA